MKIYIKLLIIINIILPKIFFFLIYLHIDVLALDDSIDHHLSVNNASSIHMIFNFIWFLKHLKLIWVFIVFTFILDFINIRILFSLKK